jgi:hypothetical protein
LTLAADLDDGDDPPVAVGGHLGVFHIVRPGNSDDQR